MRHQALLLEDTPQRLRLAEIDTPSLQAGEVRIQLKAAALNHRDQWQREGKYPGLVYPQVPGSDGAGIVVEAADADGQPWVGREVIINPNMDWGDNPLVQQPGYHIRGVPSPGTFQQLLAVPIHRLAAKPAHLTWEQAAALPLAGLTAYRATFHHGHVQAGQRVLVTGIGGGVAQFAAQFAMAQGADLWVTSGSVAKAEVWLERGAKGWANYRDDGWEKALRKASGSFHCIIDSAGGEQMNRLIDLALPGGRIVFYGATLGAAPSLNLAKVFWNQLTLQGSTMGSDADFAAMLAFVAQHGIVPMVSSMRPFADIVSAYDEMDAHQQAGKLVVTF